MKPVSEMQGSERNDYCYKVYREMMKQNPDVTLCCFRPGMDRATFAMERITLNSQNGGLYEGPTVVALIAKILKAAESV
jgi:hypothetical protein